MSKMHPMARRVRILDFFAGSPEKKLLAAALAQALDGPQQSPLADLSAVFKQQWVSRDDPLPGEKGGRYYMTAQQALWWQEHRAEHVYSPEEVAAGLRGGRPPKSATAEPLQVTEATTDLIFGIWTDGSLSIEGLGSKVIKLPAVDVTACSILLASLPEGALQALLDSPLAPQFGITVGGKRHPMQPAQAQQLLTYLESLPAKWIRRDHVPAAAATPFSGLVRPGTDHRVHICADDAPGA